MLCVVACCTTDLLHQQKISDFLSSKLTRSTAPLLSFVQLLKTQVVCIMWQSLHKFGWEAAARKTLPLKTQTQNSNLPPS